MSATKEGVQFKKAVDLLLRKPEARLILMHCNDGDHFYVVPGGRVKREAALKILARPDCREFDDGLFPGNPQSWKIGA